MDKDILQKKVRVHSITNTASSEEEGTSHQAFSQQPSIISCRCIKAAVEKNRCYYDRFVYNLLHIIVKYLCSGLTCITNILPEVLRFIQI